MKKLEENRNQFCQQTHGIYKILSHKIPIGKWPRLKRFLLGNIIQDVVCRKNPVPSSHVPEIPRDLRNYELFVLLFFQRIQHSYFIWKWFKGKTSYCTIPHQCQKTYHTQTFNNDFKKWLWTSSFLNAVHTTVIIQIACDLWVYLATTPSSHCRVKLTPQTVAMAFIEHKGADYSLINSKATSAIT